LNNHATSTEVTLDSAIGDETCPLTMITEPTSGDVPSQMNATVLLPPIVVTVWRFPSHAVSSPFAVTAVPISTSPALMSAMLVTPI